jgi:hypothetical protein
VTALSRHDLPLLADDGRRLHDAARIMLRHCCFHGDFGLTEPSADCGSACSGGQPAAASVNHCSLLPSHIHHLLASSRCPRHETFLLASLPALSRGPSSIIKQPPHYHHHSQPLLMSAEPSSSTICTAISRPSSQPSSLPPGTAHSLHHNPLRSPTAALSSLIRTHGGYHLSHTAGVQVVMVARSVLRLLAVR